MKFLLVLSLLAFATQLHAGASNATLSCQATNTGGSGITLDGKISVDFAEFNLTLANHNGALSFLFFRFVETKQNTQMPTARPPRSLLLAKGFLL